MKTAIITVDLGFGDAGKGSVVDYLCRQHEVGLVVRYNGGAQCAHNVSHKSGLVTIHHTFCQFGSGTLAGARTFLSEHVLFNPLVLQNEAKKLQPLQGWLTKEAGVALSGEDITSLVSVDARAHVTTPYHRALNRIKERVRGDMRHGSCGMGIGETVQDYVNRPDGVITAGHLREPGELRQRLQATHDDLHEKALRLLHLESATPLDQEGAASVKHELSTFDVPVEEVASSMLRASRHVRILDVVEAHGLLAEEDMVIFEGAQGVLLDQDYGFHPYTTWTATTAKNAHIICSEFVNVKTLVLGITRTYGVRHGPGPFPTADPEVERLLAEPHNRFNPWQRQFRKGWLDLVLLEYAADLAHVDAVALTHVDALARWKTWKVCDHYSNMPDLVEYPHPMGTMQQEQLTRRLFQAKPHYQVVNNLLVGAAITERLKVPVMLNSHGPLSDEKTMHGAWPVRGLVMT